MKSGWYYNTTNKKYLTIDYINSHRYDIPRIEEWYDCQTNSWHNANSNDWYEYNNVELNNLIPCPELFIWLLSNLT